MRRADGRVYLLCPDCQHEFWAIDSNLGASTLLVAWYRHLAEDHAKRPKEMEEIRAWAGQFLD